MAQPSSHRHGGREVPRYEAHRHRLATAGLRGLQGEALEVGSLGSLGAPGPLGRVEDAVGVYFMFEAVEERLARLAVPATPSCWDQRVWPRSMLRGIGGPGQGDRAWRRRSLLPRPGRRTSSAEAAMTSANWQPHYAVYNAVPAAPWMKRVAHGEPAAGEQVDAVELARAIRGTDGDRCLVPPPRARRARCRRTQGGGGRRGRSAGGVGVGPRCARRGGRARPGAFRRT